MTATVLPELAAESIATAERLGQLSAAAGLDPAEAEYLLAWGVTDIERVPRLWPIIRRRIAQGMTGDTAHVLVSRLLETVSKHLALADILRPIAQTMRDQAGQELEASRGLDAAAKRLREIQAEGSRLLAVINAPARWPGEEQLREAREDIQRGDRLTEEEFRRVLLDA